VDSLLLSNVGFELSPFSLNILCMVARDEVNEIANSTVQQSSRKSNNSTVGSPFIGVDRGFRTNMA
jgi:hypothetical protein